MDAKTRSGTETRQRIHQVNVRLNDEEFAEIAETAARNNISMAEAIRRRTFG